MPKARWSSSSFRPTAWSSLDRRSKSEQSGSAAHCRSMTDTISWFATAATIIAALLVASNLGPRPTGYGFIIFALGSVAWFVVGIRTNQPALTWTDAVLTLLNAFGVWRWLGRRAKVQDGARAAAEASEHSPGEALFPVSLLTQATVRSGSTELGRCIDAMASCRSGHIDY